MSLIAGYQAAAPWLSRNLPRGIPAAEQLMLKRTPKLLASCLNLLATPPVASQGSDIYRWGKLL